MERAQCSGRRLLNTVCRRAAQGITHDKAVYADIRLKEYFAQRDRLLSLTVEDL